MTWQVIAEAKRARRLAKLPTEWLIPDDQVPVGREDVSGFIDETDWLSPEEKEITNSSATHIVAKAASGAWKAVSIVRAFCHRATIAQQLLNPLTEIVFDEAVAIAQDLDKYFAEHGKPIGPLHGLPVSLKDSVDIRGVETTMGYVAWNGKVAERDAVITAAIRKQGGIPFVKTNVGHTLMMGETVNHLFGRTLNPYNRSLTSGGSSGGESALLAFKGSPLGIATDIGGSIRLPAASTALYGLRPSVGRMSYRGFADTFIGQEAVRSVAGPMARDPDALELLMSAYMATKPWDADPDVLPMPWRAEQPSKSLCLAYSVGDERVTPHPPLRWGLAHVIERLRRAGHTVVEWKGSLHSEASGRLMVDFWTADGGEEIQGILDQSGEPMIREVADLMKMKPVHEPPRPSVSQTWRNQHERNMLQRTFHDQWQASAEWSGTGRPMDGLILPAAPFIARPHGADLPESRFGMFEHTYTNLQPILQLSSGSFPSGLRQDPKVDVVDKDFKPRSDLDEVINALYTDPNEWTGGPIGFQLVARRLEEEKIVAMLRSIRDALE